MGKWNLLSRGLGWVAEAGPKVFGKIKGALIGGSVVGLGMAAPTIAEKGVRGTLTDGLKYVGLGATDTSTTVGLSEKEGGFYKFFAAIARFLNNIGIGHGIPEAVMSFANKGVAGANNPEVNGGFGPDGGPGGSTGGPDLGSRHAGWSSLAPVGIGAGALAGTMLLKGKGAAAAANAAEAAGEAAGLARVERAAAGASRFGRLGKILGLGILGVGGATMMLNGDEAQAATLPTPGATRTGATVENAATGSIHSMGADIAGAGLSIVGGRAAAETIAATAAPVAARLGLSTIAKSIPGVSSIYAAGETVFNVSSDLLRGDFKKAGLNLVSGVGETVAGLGGALTYFTLGAAWRESVRAGGAAVFGEENTIDHSLTYQGAELIGGAGKWLMDQFSSATTGPQTPAPRQDYTFRPAGLAPAF